MLVYPEERDSIARLLRFMEMGERVAADCASAQAALVSDRSMRRFLLGQARQETFHALAFQGAITWLAPRLSCDSPCLSPVQQYRRRLEDALLRGDLAETLLAEQVILEGLGECILSRIEAGLVKRNAPLARLRRVLLHQEEAHHAFGHRALQRMVDSGEADLESLRKRVPEYLGLVERMIAGAGDLLESIDENPSDYLPDATTLLPKWIQVKSDE